MILWRCGLWAVVEMHIELRRVPDVGKVHVTLPMTPDYRFTFSGSALPFPTEEVAFHPAQPTRSYMATGHVIQLPDVPMPNWYYRHGRLEPPRALVVYTHEGDAFEEMVVIQNVPRVPYKSLSPAPRVLASTRSCPVVTQETYLRSRAMPSRACFPTHRAW